MWRGTGDDIRTTFPTQEVLRVFLREPHAEYFGADIIKQIVSMKLKSGSLYPILQKLENAGWLTSRWELEDYAASMGRRRRRYYTLTGIGERRAAEYCATSAAETATLPAFGRVTGATS